MTIWLVTDTSLGNDASYEAKAYANFEAAMDYAHGLAREKEWDEVSLNRINYHWYFLTPNGEIAGNNAIDIVKKNVLNPEPELNTWSGLGVT